MQIELEKTTNTASLQLPKSYSNEENSKCCFSCICSLLSDDYFARVAIFVLYFYAKDMMYWIYGVNVEMVMRFREDNPAVMFLADHYI